MVQVAENRAMVRGSPPSGATIGGIDRIDGAWNARDGGADVTMLADGNAELAKVIVGQQEVVDQMLVALIAGGHCLITGAPGLAKTLLVKTVADVFDLSFNRIQFTPDLMPSDITGTEILEDTDQGRRMVFNKGPIFAHMILADEINRTPPKTQASLLEAMQEHQVTVAGNTMHLPEPFFVLATQNPIEMEGTYPLPEAQLDRFMLNIVIDYLSEDEEVAVVTRTTSGKGEPVQRLFTGAQPLPATLPGQALPLGAEALPLDTGKVFVEYLSPLKSNRIKNKLMKRQREIEREAELAAQAVVAEGRLAAQLDAQVERHAVAGRGFQFGGGGRRRDRRSRRRARRRRRSSSRQNNSRG
mgnify:CR=1 FL=1